ncbi:haloacid dehalogenase-like hydrolase family member protein [Theileria equi strain WA]|uniref:Haloacid dehalogenase-like hydrolase family member protein n=1 Tax=Theileria equi strain WA TaxID=1537102 RepID=L0AVM5_THEEQ|nr:haloacid dehalogenase-like hydrolase family member protein [Theileria equi strain WA]AFZ78929.1 haloacid dehalogenase-like hydrolase family member protein [Theileria equi strain WA]|eukprot:XP_004828595.1 haloacid dehalogenase-like hydrolase family member protein [Theileria equi strain WA]
MVVSGKEHFVKPERLPKYFGIDVDDTLHTENSEAFERNTEAFAKVREKGYVPFICTARSFDFAFRMLGKEFVEKTGYKGYPGVYNNGAIVYNDEGVLINAVNFTKEFIHKFLKCIEEGFVTSKCIFFTKGPCYSLIEIDDLWKDYLASRGLSVPDVRTAEEISEMDIVAISINSKNVEIPYYIEGVDYNKKLAKADWLYTLNPSGVTKASGVTKFLEHYDIPADNFGFIGDGYNDIEIMSMAGISFAIGNAPNEVKEHAQWVLNKTCDDGGVAEALKLVYDL